MLLGGWEVILRAHNIMSYNIFMYVCLFVYLSLFTSKDIHLYSHICMRIGGRRTNAC